MKTNNCPFLDAQNRCTHRLPKPQRNIKRKLPNCPFNSEKKCEYYNEWISGLKLIDEAERGLSDFIRKELKRTNDGWDDE